MQRGTWGICSTSSQTPKRWRLPVLQKDPQTRRLKSSEKSTKSSVMGARAVAACVDTRLYCARCAAPNRELRISCGDAGRVSPVLSQNPRRPQSKTRARRTFGADSHQWTIRYAPSHASCSTLHTLSNSGVGVWEGGVERGEEHEP